MIDLFSLFHKINCNKTWKKYGNHVFTFCCMYIFKITLFYTGVKSINTETTSVTDCNNTAVTDKLALETHYISTTVSQ